MSSNLGSWPSFTTGSGKFIAAMKMVMTGGWCRWRCFTYINGVIHGLLNHLLLAFYYVLSSINKMSAFLADFPPNLHFMEMVALTRLAIAPQRRCETMSLKRSMCIHIYIYMYVCINTYNYYI